MTFQAEDGTARTCLVVGASQGIGAAVSRRLLDRGHRVALASRSGSSDAGLPSARPLCIAADVTSTGDVERMFNQVEDKWGPVEVLVISAGIAPNGPLVEISDETWRQAMATNLDGVFFCFRRALPAMSAADWGRIVVVASVDAKRGEALAAAYTASKHGALGLVRAAAVEFARSGITVNAVCPAYVETPMTDRTIADIAQRRGWELAKARERLLRSQANGRLVQPDEVATAIEFCLASPGITGQGLNIDGGLIQS